MKKRPALPQQVELAKRAAYLHSKAAPRASKIPNKKRAAARKACRA